MKVCFPNFGALGVLLETLCREQGLDYVPPIQNMEEAMAIGAKWSPEGVCLPMKRILGEFVLGAGQGADTALFLGGAGPCRFGYFAPMIQTVLDEQGIPMKVLGLEAPDDDYRKFLKGLGELLGCSEAKVVKLLLKGWQTLRQLDFWEEKRLDILALSGEKRPMARSAATLDELRGELKHWQKRWPVPDKAPLIKVGIVGDIYTTIDPLINYHLQERLALMGVVSKRSIRLSDHLLHLLIGNRAVEKAAKPYLERGIGGFAQETVAASRQMMQQDFDGIIQVYPLSCMPEIVADGILERMQRDSHVPILRLVLDEHSGWAGYQTRMEAFVDMVRRKACRAII